MFAIKLLLIATLCEQLLAHTDIADVSQYPLYGTWQTALRIPNNLYTWRAPRFASCAGAKKYNQFWLKWTAGAAGARLLVHVGTGPGSAAGKMQNFRANVFIFGPGLRGAARKWKIKVPFAANYTVYPGAASVSTCAFLKPAGSSDVTYFRSVRTVFGAPRCVLDYSPGPPLSGYFPVLDDLFVAPRKGTYYILVYPKQTYSTSFFFLTGSKFHDHASAVKQAGNGGVGPFAAAAKTACCGVCANLIP